MRISRTYVLLCLLLAQGCQTYRSARLPSGTYTDGSGSNEIIICGREALVSLGNMGASTPAHPEERCRYRVNSDGRIALILPSVRYQTGVGRFDYFWATGRIRVVNTKTGESRFFDRANDSPPAIYCK